MMNRRASPEVELLRKERRQRENDAPRLRQEVGQLTSLALEVSEYRSAGGFLAARHTRRIVVEHAPALFEIPCTEERCRGGGYDLTYHVMRSLKSKSTEFEGEDSCPGQMGSGECGRVLHYTARASYTEEAVGTGRAGTK
jgi:hypothetical protein